MQEHIVYMLYIYPHSEYTYIHIMSSSSMCVLRGLSC